jgi:hypothetical protein
LAIEAGIGRLFSASYDGFYSPVTFAVPPALFGCARVIPWVHPIMYRKEKFESRSFFQVEVP